MIKLILALTSIFPQTSEPTINIHDWALQSYGPEMSFNIKRNGSQIGTHEVSLKTSDEQLFIEATTKIRVKFLLMFSAKSYTIVFATIRYYRHKRHLSKHTIRQKWRLS